MKHVIGAVALLALLTAPVGAQLTGTAAARAAKARADSVRADSARADSADARAASAVIVPTEPNAVRLVAIPVPAELLGRSGQFAFIRQSGFAVVGRVAGVFAPVDTQRPIVLTISVPAAAPAGRLLVGTMRFTCDSGCDALDVPVILDVQARTALQVEPTRPLVGTHAGARVRAEVTVRNVGNATEQITVAFQMPNDWRSRVLVPMPLRVAAGASALVPVEFIVSDDAGMGDYGIAVRASAAGGSTALASINVRVGAGQRGAIGWRPLLEANAALARDGNGTFASAYGAELSGELLPDVRANGRASIVPNSDNLSALTQRSLGRLGYSSNSSFLMLTAPRWEGGVGMLGASDAGLAGAGLWGAGVTGRVRSEMWQGGLFGVKPLRGGHYLLGDVSRRVGPTWTGIVASDLQDQLGLGRTSQTIAGTVEMPWRDGNVVLQAGRRGTDSSAGFGWLGRLSHRANNWSFAVRAAHAPGGAAAFAHSEDEFQVDGYRKLTKALSAGATYWNSRDGGTSGRSDFSSNGWSLTQQLSLGRLGSIGLETHASQSGGRSGVGEFGNADREIQATWAGIVAGLQTRLGASHGTLERTSSIGENVDLNARAPRTSVFGSLSAGTRFGSWQFDVTSDHTGAGVGVPTRQTSIAARVDRIPLVPGRVYVRAEVQAYYLGATNSMALSQVLGVEVRLANTYEFVVDAERNDFQRASTGVVPWVITTKVRRAIGLRALRSAALRGIVFRDLNGNGTRDRNERGMPGAVIQVDGEVVTADADGRFAIGRSRPSQIEVDPRSLPTGWMAGARPLVPAAIGEVELAVIPTAPVEVTIRLASTQGIDTANVRLDRAVVVLTDSSGRRWNGAPNARGMMRFDALPPGVYQVSADLSRVGETLVLPAELPVAQVEGGGTTVKIELRVSPRAIRLLPPGGRDRESTDGAANHEHRADAAR